MSSPATKEIWQENYKNNYFKNQFITLPSNIHGEILGFSSAQDRQSLFQATNAYTTRLESSLLGYPTAIDLSTIKLVLRDHYLKDVSDEAYARITPQEKQRCITEWKRLVETKQKDSLVLNANLILQRMETEIKKEGKKRKIESNQDTTSHKKARMKQESDPEPFAIILDSSDDSKKGPMQQKIIDKMKRVIKKRIRAPSTRTSVKKSDVKKKEIPNLFGKQKEERSKKISDDIHKKQAEKAKDRSEIEVVSNRLEKIRQEEQKIKMEKIAWVCIMLKESKTIQQALLEYDYDYLDNLLNSWRTLPEKTQMEYMFVLCNHPVVLNVPFRLLPLMERQFYPQQEDQRSMFQLLSGYVTRHSSGETQRTPDSEFRKCEISETSIVLTKEKKKTQKQNLEISSLDWEEGNEEEDDTYDTKEEKKTYIWTTQVLGMFLDYPTLDSLWNYTFSKRMALYLASGLPSVEEKEKKSSKKIANILTIWTRLCLAIMNHCDKRYLLRVHNDALPNVSEMDFNSLLVGNDIRNKLIRYDVMMIFDHCYPLFERWESYDVIFQHVFTELNRKPNLDSKIRHKLHQYARSYQFAYRGIYMNKLIPIEEKQIKTTEGLFQDFLPEISSNSILKTCPFWTKGDPAEQEDFEFGRNVKDDFLETVQVWNKWLVEAKNWNKDEKMRKLTKGIETFLFRIYCSRTAYDFTVEVKSPRNDQLDYLLDLNLNRTTILTRAEIELLCTELDLDINIVRKGMDSHINNVICMNRTEENVVALELDFCLCIREAARDEKDLEKRHQLFDKILLEKKFETRYLLGTFEKYGQHKPARQRFVQMFQMPRFAPTDMLYLLTKMGLHKPEVKLDPAPAWKRAVAFELRLDFLYMPKWTAQFPDEKRFMLELAATRELASSHYLRLVPYHAPETSMVKLVECLRDENFTTVYAKKMYNWYCDTNHRRCADAAEKVISYIYDQNTAPEHPWVFEDAGQLHQVPLNPFDARLYLRLSFFLLSLQVRYQQQVKESKNGLPLLFTSEQLIEDEKKQMHNENGEMKTGNNIEPDTPPSVPPAGTLFVQAQEEDEEQEEEEHDRPPMEESDEGEPE